LPKGNDHHEDWKKRLCSQQRHFEEEGGKGGRIKVEWCAVVA